MTYIEWINFSKKILKKYNINTLYSELILSFVKKIKFEEIYINENFFLSKNEINKLNDKLKKKIIGIPIEYILNRKEFWSINFYINNLVFIPRNSTESLVEFILNYINFKKKYDILDLGSGSGVISISLSKEIKNSNILGIDANPYAVKISNINKKNICPNNELNFIKSKWYKNVNKKFNIIISNPPYMSKNEFFNKKYKILFDPVDSIISINNSLYNINHIIKFSKNYIKDNGLLIIEHGKLQGNSVRKIFKKYNFYKIKTFNDLDNLERFTIGIY